VGLPATARWRGLGCGGRPALAHGECVGRVRGRGWSAGEDAAEAQDERAAEVAVGGRQWRCENHTVAIVLPATVRWRNLYLARLIYFSLSEV
jgi:hypothetical protein